MRIKNILAVSVLTVAGLAVTSGTCTAAPGDDLSVDLAPGINYTARVADDTVVITTDGGKLTVADGKFEVRSESGRLLAGLPLDFHLDDRKYPIEARIDGNTATLRPITEPARSTKVEPVLAREGLVPVTAKTREDRERNAWDTMTRQVGFSVTIGAIVGAVVAAAAGCVIGGVVAAPTAVVTAVLGPLAGCATGAVAMAPIGAIGGTLFVAAPVAVASAVQYFSAVNAPFVATA